MKALFEVRGDFEEREAVKDATGFYICEGIYVLSDGRQGYVTEVVDENGCGMGKIKVRVVREGINFLKEHYVTDFEPARNWYRAYSDG